MAAKQSVKKSAAKKSPRKNASKRSPSKRPAETQFESAVEITRELLRVMPLPHPGAADDKEARGRVLVVGGGYETPGATILAGTAALRAGAGKLQVTVPDPLYAAVIGARLPEARALPFNTYGGSQSPFDECLREADAVCVGPGWTEPNERGFPLARLSKANKTATLVIDAKAVAGFLNSPPPAPLRTRAILTPNAEELSEIMSRGGKDAPTDPLEVARRAAREFQTIVVMKGRETFIAAPDGRVYVNRAGNVGLATSGSGDVLAGLVAGLAARGAAPLMAAVWGVHAHAVAGDLLARRVAPLGFLARELLDVLPRVLWELAAGTGAAVGEES